MSLWNNVKSKYCFSPLQNPRQKDNYEIQLLVLQHLINVDIFTEKTKYFIGVNMIYTRLTGSPKLFSHYASKGICGLASYFGLDYNSPSLWCSDDAAGRGLALSSSPDLGSHFPPPCPLPGSRDMLPCSIARIVTVLVSSAFPHFPFWPALFLAASHSSLSRIFLQLWL